MFTRRNHRDAVIDSLRYCIAHKGLNVYAYCLMSNHLHLLVNTEAPFELKDVIRDFKKHTAKTIFHQIQEELESRREWMLSQFGFVGKMTKGNTNFKFWQAGNHAIEIYSPGFTLEKITYIHMNPVVAGLVSQPEHWCYSSAGNYAGHEDVLLPEVECLTPILARV